MLQADSARNRLTGIGLVSLCYLLFSLLDGSAKWLVGSMPVIMVVWLRFALHAVIGANPIGPESLYSAVEATYRQLRDQIRYADGTSLEVIRGMTALIDRVAGSPICQAVLGFVNARRYSQFNHRPDLVARSCQPESGGTGTWEFMDYLVEQLRLKDLRWGYHARRGVASDPARDEVAYHWGPGPDEGSRDAYAWDIMGSHCGSNPQPAWLEVTDLGVMWISRGKF